MLEPPGTAVHDVFSARVATRHIRKDIQFKEMQAVNHALHLWLDQLRGMTVALYCDNDACVHGLSKLSIRGLAMAPLRQIATRIAAEATPPVQQGDKGRYDDIRRLLPRIRRLSTRRRVHIHSP